MKNKEQNIIKKQLRKVERLALRMVLIYGIVAALGFIIPFGFLPKAGKRFRGNFSETLPNQIGSTNYLLIMILICLVITGLILYFNKYFELKKDLNQQQTLKLAAVVEQTKYTNSDFGEAQIIVMLRANKYGVKKIRIDADAIDAHKISAGQKLEFSLSANAYFPLDFKVQAKENSNISKEKIDGILEAIQNVKNKSEPPAGASRKRKR